MLVRRRATAFLSVAMSVCISSGEREKVAVGSAAVIASGDILQQILLLIRVTLIFEIY